MGQSLLLWMFFSIARQFATITLLLLSFFLSGTLHNTHSDQSMPICQFVCLFSYYLWQQCLNCVQFVANFELLVLRQTFVLIFLLIIFVSQNLIFLFFFTVIQQPYSVQVYGEYAIAGNTGHMKCQIPAFVRDYVKVTAWLKGDAIVATSLSPKGMFNFLS